MSRTLRALECNAMRVFLSHSISDAKYAAALRQQLAQLGVDVWSPERDLLPGSNWLLETGRALERAEGVVFLFSKAASRSPWSRKEVEYAITQPKFEGRLVSVLLSRDLEIPWILNNLPLVNAAGHEPAFVARSIARKLGAKTARPRRVASPSPKRTGRKRAAD